MRNPALVIGYVLGGAMIVAGILILIGLFRLRAAWDPLFATMFGLVVLLFGLYRIVITDTKRRRREREERIEGREE